LLYVYRLLTLEETAVFPPFDVFRKCVWRCTLALAAFGTGTAVAQPTYTFFDPPGSTQTEPHSINDVGEIAGSYTEGSQGTHGFVRAPDGTIMSFDPSGSVFT
jgi:hypothetical protein